MFKSLVSSVAQPKGGNFGENCEGEKTIGGKKEEGIGKKQYREERKTKTIEQKGKKGRKERNREEIKGKNMAPKRDENVPILPLLTKGWLYVPGFRIVLKNNDNINVIHFTKAQKISLLTFNSKEQILN